MLKNLDDKSCNISSEKKPPRIIEMRLHGNITIHNYTPKSDFDVTGGT